MRLTAISSVLVGLWCDRARADEPPPPPAVEATPPETAPPPVAPPTPARPELPASVTPIDDPRIAVFALSGGNRISARRVGEDADFIWVDRDGQLARIRKSEIVSIDYGGGSTAAAPLLSTQPVPALPPSLEPVEPRRSPRGRGMVIWGGILLGVGYTLAVIAAIDNSFDADGENLLLLIPAAGPFVFASTDAAGEEPGPWIVDGLLQVGGAVLLFLGLSRMSADDTPERRVRAGIAPTRGGAIAWASLPTEIW